jgi:hypothetical protein
MAGTFSEEIKELARGPAFNDLSLRIVKKRSHQRNFAAPDLLTYAAAVTIIVSQGPDAAKRLKAALEVIKRLLDSKKIKYEVDWD